MDMYNREILDNLINATSEDDILNEIGYDNVASWLGCLGGFKYSIQNNNEALMLVKELGRFLSPRRYLDKNDLKKEISDFIDFWYI